MATSQRRDQLGKPCSWSAQHRSHHQEKMQHRSSSRTFQALGQERGQAGTSTEGLF